ncbi:MAG: hypothetical protein JWP95_2124 [Actinotalea sp.]|nr:hypothetical protein [Actinotalea sp.]
MNAWTEAELARLGEAEELRVASTRRDGTLRPSVTVWTVRVGDGLYVRSAYGATNPWFVRATASGRGRIRAGGVEHDVRFAPADADAAEAIDAAYHAKYDRHGARVVGTVVGPQVHGLTLRLVPAAGQE